MKRCQIINCPESLHGRISCGIGTVWQLQWSDSPSNRAAESWVVQCDLCGLGVPGCVAVVPPGRPAHTAGKWRALPHACKQSCWRQVGTDLKMYCCCWTVGVWLGGGARGSPAGVAWRGGGTGRDTGAGHRALPRVSRVWRHWSTPWKVSPSLHHRSVYTLFWCHTNNYSWKTSSKLLHYNGWIVEMSRTMFHRIYFAVYCHTSFMWILPSLYCFFVVV